MSCFGTKLCHATKIKEQKHDERFQDEKLSIMFSFFDVSVKLLVSC